MDNQTELKGLRGWLILVGIGTVIAPIAVMITLMSEMAPVLSDGTWEALTTEGSEFYHPLWGTLITGEICFNLALILVGGFAIYLFFTKNYRFPRVYIGIVVASLVFTVLDAGLLSMILPTEPMFDAESMRSLGRNVAAACIWIPYMLISKRVRATFVEGRRFHPADISIHRSEGKPSRPTSVNS